jgi:hypothetical protein
MMWTSTTAPWRTAVAAVMLAASLAACSGDDGITLVGSIDDSTLDEAARAERTLRLAVWVGREPGAGVRPDQVTDWKEVESREQNVLNPFLWQTRLRPSVTADLWVGAFYESNAALDGVPAEGDSLAVIGPLAVSSEELRGLAITMSFGDAVSRPSVDVALGRLTAALIDGDADAFLAALHPFYGDPMRLDWHTMPSWAAGTWGEGGTAYTTPVSAPLAGFLSAATREAVGMANVTWATELSNNNSLTANGVLSYSLATTLGSRINFSERWLLTFRTTPDDLLASRIHVQTQDVAAPDLHDVQIQTSDPFAADQGIVVRWTDTTNTLAEAYEVTLDRFASADRSWVEVGASTPVPVNSSAEYQLAVGTSLQAAIVHEPQEDAFYRIRVHPIRGGDRQVPSTAFVRGPDYPY